MKITTALATALAFAATAATAQGKPAGYTCCNLHYDKDWISDANWGRAAMIPAGAKIRVLDYSEKHANVEIDGKPMRMGQDYGRADEPLEKYISKLVVKAHPRSKIEKYPEKIRSAVKSGHVIPGMTREQVIIAVGYPPTHRTKTLDSRVWNHWASRAGRYEVHWNDKGTVERIVGNQ